ncbi:MAG: NAD(P)/FAD-dependent oxidoreductase [Paludibacter sp.]|nr:NAD(P)/FAD-dependent oxidoreductase [Paludibacter sp.]
MNVAVIGGGAAGFFSAIAVKENYPNANVTIYEKTKYLLSKVKISGGGRCNFTNRCTSIPELCKAYPRGGKELKKLFHIFNTTHTMEWFKSRGVEYVIQEDNCVFPVSQDAQTIIDCFLRESHRLKISIERGNGIVALKSNDDKWEVQFENSEYRIFDKIIVSTGGSPQMKGLDWLADLGHVINPPVPSLFSFKIPDNPVTKLMGVVVENIIVSFQGTKFKGEGPLLITHWGMSGPAILKLSSFGARWLKENRYEGKIQVNWANNANNDIVLNDLIQIAEENPKKLVTNNRPYDISSRLWLFFLDKCEIPVTKNWADLTKKNMNRLMNILCNDEYTIRGRAAFKEEFVTCGGVSLQSINMVTLESKVCKNLYFAGEVLDIDAITGGYNLQAAWTTGFIAGKLG